METKNRTFSTRICRFGLLALAGCLAISAPVKAAAFLMVDFGDVGQVVQGGWEGATRAIGGGNNENLDPALALPAHADVTAYGTVTHSVATAPGTYGLDFRERSGIYAPNYVHPTLGQVGNVLRDLVRSQSNSLDLKFTGLNAGQYKITTFHHDWFGTDNYDWAEFDIAVEQEAGGGFTTAHAGVSASSNGTNPITNPAYYDTTFNSAGPSSQITIRITPLAGTSAIFIETPTNGFALEAIPEPSSALLLGIGTLAIGAFRRR